MLNKQIKPVYTTISGLYESRKKEKGARLTTDTLMAKRKLVKTKLGDAEGFCELKESRLLSKKMIAIK